MKRILGCFVSIVYILGLLAPAAVSAEESTEQDQGGFTYEVVKPENQRSDVGYYDLKMTPGQKQTIQLQLNNSSDEEIKMGVYLNSAKTNSNGVVEYGPNTIKKDASLKYDITDIVKGPEGDEVTLPPKTQTTVEFAITMPEASFDGYISGGIQLERKDEDDHKQTGMVVNKFAYLIGFLLSETEGDPEANLKQEMKLNKVYAAQQNFRNIVFINFSNVQPMYVEEMTIDAQIMGKDSDEVLFDSKKSGMRMAPNSSIDFPVSMAGEAMVPGDYRARIVVTTEAGGKWEWEQAFKITDEEADKFNQQSVDLDQGSGINWLLVGLIVGGLLLLIVIIYLIIRLANKKNKSKKTKKRNKSKQ